MSNTSMVNNKSNPEADTSKIAWEKPVLNELDVFETANGFGSSDGMGGGSVGDNSSGS